MSAGDKEALLTRRTELGKAFRDSFADGKAADARTHLLDLANSFETEDDRRIADDHRGRDTCALVRISEMHATGVLRRRTGPRSGAQHWVSPHEVLGYAFFAASPRPHRYAACLRLSKRPRLLPATLAHLRAGLAVLCRTVLEWTRLRDPRRSWTEWPLHDRRGDDDDLDGRPFVSGLRQDLPDRDQ